MLCDFTEYARIWQQAPVCLSMAYSVEILSNTFIWFSCRQLLAGIQTSQETSGYLQSLGKVETTIVVVRWDNLKLKGRNSLIIALDWEMGHQFTVPHNSFYYSVSHCEMGWQLPDFINKLFRAVTSKLLEMSRSFRNNNSSAGIS